MTKQEKRNKLVAYFLALSIILTLSYAFLNLEQRKEIELKEDRVISITTKEREIRDLTAKYELSTEQEVINKRLQTLNEMLPSSANENQFITKIKQRAIANNLELKNLKPQGLTEKESYNYRTYKMNFLGAYQDYINFLSSLAKLKRLYNIKTTALKASKSGVSVEILVQVYFLQDDIYV